MFLRQDKSFSTDSSLDVAGDGLGSPIGYVAAFDPFAECNNPEAFFRDFPLRKRIHRLAAEAVQEVNNFARLRAAIDVIAYK